MNTTNLTMATDEPSAETTDLYMGLGSVVYALTTVDKRLYSDNGRRAMELLAGMPNGNLALASYLQGERCNETVEEAYALALKRFTNNRKSLNAITRAQFINILLQIADANDVISLKQQELINRFRRDLRRLALV